MKFGTPASLGGRGGKGVGPLRTDGVGGMGISSNSNTTVSSGTMMGFWNFFVFGGRAGASSRSGLGLTALGGRWPLLSSPPMPSLGCDA